MADDNHSEHSYWEIGSDDRTKVGDFVAGVVAENVKQACMELMAGLEVDLFASDSGECLELHCANQSFYDGVDRRFKKILDVGAALDLVISGRDDEELEAVAHLLEVAAAHVRSRKGQ